MGLDQDARTRMFLLRDKQHLKKPVAIGARRRNGRIATGLVDDQHISGFRHFEARVEARVFAQMYLLHPRHRVARGVQNSCVIQRMCGQYLFQIGGGRRVKMDALVVDQQTNRWAACAARKDRTKKCIFDPDKAGIAFIGNGFTTVGGGRIAPNADQAIRLRQSNGDVVTGKLDNAPHASARQKTAIVNVKPPGLIGSGGRVTGRTHKTDQLLPSMPVASELKPVSGVVSDVMILANCVNGASVTYSVSPSRITKSLAWNMPFGCVRFST